MKAELWKEVFAIADRLEWSEDKKRMYALEAIGRSKEENGIDDD